MNNCNECAALCCIAPEIRTPDNLQGRVKGRVIKIANAVCENLNSGNQCGIYDSRGLCRDNCITYDCHDFGPTLTKYLRENGLIGDDRTLDPQGMIIFSLLNGMLQLSNMSHGVNTDLETALQWYRENNIWPGWMLDEKYKQYLLGKYKNPRFEQTELDSVPLTIFSLAQKIRNIASNFLNEFREFLSLYKNSGNEGVK